MIHTWFTLHTRSKYLDSPEPLLGSLGLFRHHCGSDPSRLLLLWVAPEAQGVLMAQDPSWDRALRGTLLSTGQW